MVKTNKYTYDVKWNRRNLLYNGTKVLNILINDKFYITMPLSMRSKHINVIKQQGSIHFKPQTELCVRFCTLKYEHCQIKNSNIAFTKMQGW